MNEKAQEIIDYIVREVIRRPHKQIIITEDTPLVSGGLIDSLALVGILFKLEGMAERGCLNEQLVYEFIAVASQEFEH